MKELVKTKVNFTTNNTMFLKPSIKKGLLNQWSEYYFNRRKQIKKKMVKAHKDGDAEKEELYNTMQMSYKLALNSLYGITGTRFSPIGNPDIAQTITRQGKFCNLSANAYVGEEFKRIFCVSDLYRITCGGDTDSCQKSTLIDVIYC